MKENTIDIKARLMRWLMSVLKHPYHTVQCNRLNQAYIVALGHYSFTSHINYNRLQF